MGIVTVNDIEENDRASGKLKLMSNSVAFWISSYGGFFLYLATDECARHRLLHFILFFLFRWFYTLANAMMYLSLKFIPFHRIHYKRRPNRHFVRIKKIVRPRTSSLRFAFQLPWKIGVGRNAIKF